MHRCWDKKLIGLWPLWRPLPLTRGECFIYIFISNYLPSRSWRSQMSQMQCMKDSGGVVDIIYGEWLREVLDLFSLWFLGFWFWFLFIYLFFYIFFLWVPRYFYLLCFASWIATFFFPFQGFWFWFCFCASCCCFGSSSWGILRVGFEFKRLENWDLSCSTALHIGIRWKIRSPKYRFRQNGEGRYNRTTSAVSRIWSVHLSTSSSLANLIYHLQVKCHPQTKCI